MTTIDVAVPPGGFGVILADPPWRFRTWGEHNQKKSASRHYVLMEQPDIDALPVASLAAKNCALFMWVIDAMIPHALTTGAAWGFNYKTVAFVWAKTSLDGEKFPIGTGYWTRANPELCLLFTRGKPQRVDRGVRKLLMAPRREHSRKPDEQYDRIERLVAGPYLELFARQSRPGWTSWGNQAEKFDAPAIDIFG
jgi:N6-adenosine-specific RNA methylase IME4